ncbi:14123_t:CDS:2 [Acaulospora colombiana]|uniref:14123_t:CDS:1 n=1 Tax=Acaulospora colombiana TaxID=27376 RepID=A0ACA9PJC0_9GLOM|nr:14123_t:CDS:2 [Acaulospora colombiana]
MSINWVELNQADGPLPIGQERFMPPWLAGARFKISIPGPVEVDSVSNANNFIDLNATGTVFLSDMRLVFVSNDPRKEPTPTSFSSFSVHYSDILGNKYEQPWFGGNYVELIVKPIPEGGLLRRPGSVAKVQIRTDGAGLYQFSTTLNARMQAAYLKKQEVDALRECAL